MPVKTSRRKLTVTIQWVILTQPECFAGIGAELAGDTGDAEFLRGRGAEKQCYRRSSGRRSKSERITGSSDMLPMTIWANGYPMPLRRWRTSNEPHTTNKAPFARYNISNRS